MNNKADTKKRDLVIALVLLNVIWVILLCLVGVTDETKDDFSIQLYISDCDGIANYYHMWASAFRMIFTYWLQRLCPVFAWTYLLHVIVIFISMNIICVRIMRTFPSVYGKLFAAFTGIVLFFQTIATLNFTRTAALVLSAGICLLFEQTRKAKVFGLIWFLIGSLIRFNVVYIAVGFLGIVCLSGLLYADGSLWERIRKISRSYVLPVILVLALSFGLKYAWRGWIDSVPEWKQLYDKNLMSESLLDYDLKPYDELRGEYEKYGITENDCEMIRLRMSNSDNEYFSPELYQVFISEFSEKWQVDLSKETLYIWIVKNGRYLCKSMFGWFILVMLFLGFLKSGRKDKWLIALDFAVFGAYLLLFCILGRIVDRVSFCVYLLAGTAMLNACRFPVGCWTEKEESSLKRIVPIGILILAFAAGMGVKYHHQTDDTVAKLFDYMEANKDYFYVHYGFHECKSVKNLLFTKDYWNTDNSFYSSNFDVSPNEISKTSAYHIDNLYRDAVNSDTIRFINKENMDVIETYIREHYCSTAQAVLVDELEGYQVYKIVDASHS